MGFAKAWYGGLTLLHCAEQGPRGEGGRGVVGGDLGSYLGKSLNSILRQKCERSAERLVICCLAGNAEHLCMQAPSCSFGDHVHTYSSPPTPAWLAWQFCPSAIVSTGQLRVVCAKSARRKSEP